ncbi:hypothetical protein BASA81_005598 [Batrachochytrium salamandrivorans]|nr:hypothetical protein BASA81_005598 [Batrachochytrium salamandrivorans]
MLGLLRRRSSARPPPTSAAVSPGEFSFVFSTLASLFASLGKDDAFQPDSVYQDCRAQTPEMKAVLDSLLKSLRKKPKAFISHFKSQAGTSAQILCSMMEKHDLQCFLDSDDLERLDQLAFQVMASTMFYLLMSPYETNSVNGGTDQFGPFGRPYCLVEIVTWYLNRGQIAAHVIILEQHGKPTSRFPQSLEEMTSILDVKGWEVVSGALGRNDCNVLAFQASQALQALAGLPWEPNHPDRAVSKLQFQVILESSGVRAVGDLDNDLSLLSGPTIDNNKKKAATASSSSSASSNKLQISLLYCNDDASDEASLIATRTEAEFGEQVDISFGAEQALGMFVLVLMTPKMLHDQTLLRGIATAVENKSTLVPVLISRIGLEQFDYAKSPLVDDGNGIQVASAFAHLKTILAKPLAPHSSSNQVTVQLGAIWGVMGISNASSQFRGVPFLQDAYSLVLNKAGQFVAGTRAWVFDELLNWAVAPKQSNVFVLQSTAGLGKSVLQAEFCKRYSASVAARAKTSTLGNGNLAVVAFHFFKHDDTSLNSARVAIGSISRQLANTLDGFKVCLEDSLKTCTGDELKDLEALFRKCVLEPLKKCEGMTGDRQGGALVVLLDGLDECSDRAELAVLLGNLWPQVPLLKLVLSTRPSADKWDRFQQLLIKQDDANNLLDVHVFLTAKLGIEQTNAVKIVERNANGLFLYATFACEQLKGEQDVETAARNLPVSMDGIYVDYFTTLQQEFQQDPMLYTGALAPVLASRVPIPERIWRAACFEASSQSFTKLVSGSQLSQLKAQTEFNKRVKEPLLRLLDFNNGCVSFLHKSMGDFLQTAPQVELRVSRSIGHELLASVCQAFTFTGESWDKLAGQDEVFVSAHSLFHFVKCPKLYKTEALQSALQIDSLLRNIRVAQLDSNYERLVDDIRTVEDVLDSKEDVIGSNNLKFTLSLLILVERAVMRDPREFAGQILGRVMIPEFDSDQQLWVTQAQDWLRRSELKVPVPAFFGRSGLQPAGTALLKMLGNNAFAVGSVAMAPNSQFCAFCTGNMVKLYDVKTGKLLNTLLLNDNTQWFRSVAIAPNSQFCITGASDGTLIRWDTPSGENKETIATSASEMTSVQISSTGRYLVAGGKSNQVSVYDLEDGNRLLQTVGHNAAVSSVAMTPDQSQIACGLGDNTTRLYAFTPSTGKLKLEATLKGHSQPVLCVAYSPDSTQICTSAEDKTAVVWSLSTLKAVHRLSPHSWPVLGVQFSPDGKFVVTAAQDKLIRMFDTKTGELITTLRGHNNHVVSVSISSDSKLILTGSADRTCRLWDATSTRALRKLETHKGGVRQVSVAPNGKEMCTGANDRAVKVWDVNTNQCLQTLYESEEGLTAVKFAPDSRTIAAGGYEKRVVIWRDNVLVRKLEGLRDPPRLILFTPDSKFVWAKPWKESPMAWDLETGEPVPNKDVAEFVENETIVTSTREGFVDFAGGEVGLTLDIENTKLVRYEDKLLGGSGEGFEYWTLGDSECRGQLL